jgi:hypothetical protein
MTFVVAVPSLEFATQIGDPVVATSNRVGPSAKIFFVLLLIDMKTGF